MSLQGQSNPIISVIVPTHQRTALLLRCLNALARQTYPRDAYEIVVVDDGPGTDTVVALNDLKAANNVAIRLVTQPTRGGPASARNAGAAAAAGTYLAFTDDDCEPAPDWIDRLAAHLNANPGAAVGGLIVNSLPSVPYSTASQLLIDYLYDYYRVDVTGNRFFTSNNLAMRAADFRTVGGFDESFPLAAAEDREFCERWQRFGHRLVYAPDVIVSHGHKLNLRGYLQQHFNYGRGADFLHRSRARYEGASDRPKLEPLSFYFNLILFPLKRMPTWREIPMVALMAVSQLAYGAGYLVERFRRWRRP